MRQKSEKKNSVIDIIIGVFFVICIILLVLILISKKDNNAPNIFGYEYRLVLSGSMEESSEVDVSSYKIKSIKKDSVIKIKKVPTDINLRYEFYKDLKVGDVVTFKYVHIYQDVITHRITNIEEKTGGFLITLRGDNTPESESQVIDTTDTTGYNFIIGKVVSTNLWFGKVVSFVSSKVGIVVCIILPASIILIVEVMRISSIVTKEKLGKSDSSKQEEQDEIKRLKEEIERLKKENN